MARAIRAHFTLVAFVEMDGSRADFHHIGILRQIP